MRSFLSPSATKVNASMSGSRHHRPSSVGKIPYPTSLAPWNPCCSMKCVSVRYFLKDCLPRFRQNLKLLATHGSLKCPIILYNTHHMPGAPATRSLLVRFQTAWLSREFGRILRKQGYHGEKESEPAGNYNVRSQAAQF